ncbi:hypothetical protein SKAU_G00144200 [Synaphobranchus kaupii]|uniref:Serine-rich coiled-coil domain-containing protein 2 n=1 Tax=Synaphobranchus kaupii TaxID=118154 RepID=A0A9Q1FTA4_SYNKA|nr:hypothetical protein SKAU_G00144200 [Synaphobranchus kaupii]
MEEKAPNKPNMVSRLPKFGARPQGGTNSLTNGTGQPLHSQEGKGAGPVGKSNGLVRLAPPFTLKWKKGGGSLLSPMEEAESQTQGEEGRAGHRPPASAATTGAQRAQEAIGSQRQGAAVRLCRDLRHPQTSLGPGLHSNKLNGAPGRFGLGIQRVGSNPGTGLSQSSDSLKAPPVDNMVRSQSFTHFKQVPSPTAQPIARSFSFTRATERANSLLAKTATLQAAARGGAGRPAGGPGPPSNLKKVLLPACVPSKAPALAYRLTRPSLGRQPRPLLGGKTRGGGGDSLATSPVTPDPPSEAEDVPAQDSCPAELPVTCDPEPSTRYLGEVLEDMSLSSTSSLECNDNSEEYLDDFDNLGDGGGMLLFPAHDGGVHQSQPCTDDNVSANSPPATPTQTRHCSFLTDTVDWAAMGLTGVKEDLAVPYCRGNQAGSPEVDFPHGSSLDLSPSDSSGGTYMWDEEGLEPLGTIARPCGSYDSDLNSLDILNNLDNLESCDLEDDDLMLDVDLPEDGSLHSGECDGAGSRPPRATPRPPGDITSPRAREGDLFSRRFRILPPLPPPPQPPAHGRRGAPRSRVNFGAQNATPSRSALSRELSGKAAQQEYNSTYEQGLPFKRWHSRTLPDATDQRNVAVWLKAAWMLMGCPILSVQTGGGGQGHWRRRQHRWSGSDYFHNDNRGGGFQQFDGHLGQGPGRVGARQLQAVVRNDGHTGALDELTLSHMAEECSSVKSQLLKLKMLLQVDGGGTIQAALESGILSPEPREDPGTSLQVEELLKEVEELREELRSKEGTIAQMAQQVSGLPAHAPTCQCQQRRPESREEMRTNHDKATQTPWRAHGPPVLQPSILWPSERLSQERLARTASTVDPSDIAMATGDDGQPRDRPCPASRQDTSTRPAPGSDQLGLLLSSRLRPPDGEAAPWHRPAGGQRQPAPPSDPAPAERDHGDSRPRVLQSLRLHKKVSVPALSQEGSAPRVAGGGRPANPMPGSSALPKKRQLPPPTRGLPCFSSAPPVLGSRPWPHPVRPDPAPRAQRTRDRFAQIHRAHLS